MEHVPAAIAMFDRGMRYIAASRRWLSDYRLGDLDIVGRSHYEIFPEVPERWKNIHQRCLAGAVERCEEDPFPRTDGATDWVRWEIRPWRDRRGDVGGLLIFTEVITERKRGEEALRRLAAIVDSSDDAIFSKTLDGTILSWNAGAERIYGYRAEEVIGQPVSLLTPVDHPDEIPNILERLKRGGGVEHYETVRVCKDGRRIDVSLTISPIRDDTGHVIGASTVARDITQRRRAEDERAQLLARERQARVEAELVKERLSLLAEASKQLASSLEYKTTLANVANLAVPGLADWCVVDALNADGAIRRVAVAHVDPSKIDLALEVERRYPPDPNASSGVPNVLRTGKSELYPDIPDSMLAEEARDPEHLKVLRDLGLTSAMIVPLVGHDRIVGVMTFVAAKPGRHYTANDLEMAEELARRCAAAIENSLLYKDAQALNVELEQRVAHRTAQLEVANKELESFAYTVAHDLRAPLITINGFSRVLLEDYASTLGDEAQGYVRQVGENAQRMGELIDDLLDFSRLSRQPLNKQQAAAADIVRQALADLDGARAHRHVDIVIGDLPACHADPALLKQVFANLLSNALKYTRTRETAAIEIGWRGDADEHGFHTYFVKDNGVGFDMRYADKLFRVFQRLHRAEEYEGTGVGLAIVQRIIHRLGGRVWAEAEVDKGATFYFTLERSATT
jgi:PAS domain S-box-containing protein